MIDPAQHMNGTLDPVKTQGGGGSGITVTDDDRHIKGLIAAFESKEARAAFIAHTHGVILVSSSDDADDPSAQIEYVVKADESTPEMAFALMKQMSYRITIFTARAPFVIHPSMVSQAIQDQFSGVSLTHKVRRSTAYDSEGRPMTGIMGGEIKMHARIAIEGKTQSLPTVIIINQWPLRYKIQEGFMSKHCNGCHQNPCVCDDAKAEVERSLAFKTDMRGKQKARAAAKTQASGSSSGYNPPSAQQDARSALLAKRGAAGKAMMHKRTAKQKTPECRAWAATGKCERGSACAFRHSMGTSNRCTNMVSHVTLLANVPSANVPTAVQRLEYKITK